MTSVKQFVFSFLCLFFAANGCFAENSQHTTAQLISEVRSIEPGKPFTVGVLMKMDEHWHIYWKNPGDAGIPPKIQWDLPEGFTAGEIQWPVPEKISTPPLMCFGYEGSALLMVDILPPKNLPLGETVTLKAKLDWLECSDICLPGKGDVSLTLPVSPKALGLPSPLHTEIVTQAKKTLPEKSDEWDISVSRDEKALHLKFAKKSPPVTLPTEAFFFPGEEGFINNAGEQVIHPDKDGFVLDVPIAYDATAKPEKISGIFVAKIGAKEREAFSIDVAIPNAAMVAAKLKAPAMEPPLFGTVLLYAFLGGLILNLMPCVFPVLSLKILNFVHAAGESRGRLALHGVAFSAGVLFSFWALAGLLISLKASGQLLGWGFQFQNPIFALFLAILLFLVGLNLMGVFEIGSSLTGLGGNLQGEGLTASFISGVFATIVATPCTGPFMGLAVGYALSQPAEISFLVFTFLALGMAAPYMVLTLNPGLLKFLPRPGAWMETFKQIMAFPMFGAVVWMIWILSGQTGSTGVLYALSGLLMVGIAAWIYGKWSQPHLSSQVRGWALVGTFFFLILTFATFVGISSLEKNQTTQSADGWETFTPQRLVELRAAGKPVFIDFTAKWCLTCQVNKVVALDRAEVQKKFKEKGVTLLWADWTNQDEVIRKTLEGYGRAGVPLYVLYGSDQNAPPVILPEILTPGIVLDALEKLK